MRQFVFPSPISQEDLQGLKVAPNAPQLSSENTPDEPQGGDAQHVVYGQSHGHSHAHCHGHSHGHSHGHNHSHHYHDMTGRRLLWTSLLNIIFTTIEIVGGVISNSLSLLSDALHNLADSSAIFVAYLAHLISKRKPTERKTFGYRRFEILAAFLNAIVLIGICLYLFVEAYRRFVAPEPIDGVVMLVVAIAGLLANLASVLILYRDKAKTLNVRAAYLHLLGDTLSSVAVIIGGIFIWLFEIMWLDPLITVAVSIYIIWHTWHVLKESVDILMQGTPPGIEITEVKALMARTEHVKDVHHIHIWRLDDQRLHLEAHVSLCDDIPVSEAGRLRETLVKLLNAHYGITHTTLQIEYDSCSDSHVDCSNCLN